MSNFEISDFFTFSPDFSRFSRFSRSDNPESVEILNQSLIMSSFVKILRERKVYVGILSL